MSEQSRDRDLREVHQLAVDAAKSDWQERTAPTAGDPVSDDERKGLNVLGQSDPRGDGSLHGVSEPNAGDVGAEPPVVAPGEGERRNPPLVRDAGMGDGGLSASGGAAGGA